MPGIVLGLLILGAIGFLLWRSRRRTIEAFTDWRRAVEGAARGFGLATGALPESYAALKRRHMLDRAGRIVLAEGVVDGRRLRVHSLMIGDALATEFEAEIALPGTLEAYTSRSDAAVLGFGPLLLSAKGTRAERPGLLLCAADAPTLSEAATDRLAALLANRPRTANLSRQLRPFWSKSMRVDANRARLTDYGLVRDAVYLSGLLREFLAVVEMLEAEAKRSHSAA
jgi:hypothetical protein